jgi:hypothetical protein
MMTYCYTERLNAGFEITFEHAGYVLSLQASFNTVKSLHFAKINQDRIALLLIGDLN